MNRKVVSMFLALCLLFSMCVPASAVDRVQDQDKEYSEKFEYVDDFGEKYHGVYTYDGEKAVVAVYDATGNLVSKAEREQGSDYIVETVYHGGRGKEFSSRDNTKETKILNVNDFVIPVLEKDLATTTAVRTVEIDIPGSTSYTSKGMYNTDYLYQGRILKGEAFYRQTGNVDEYDRMSYKFARNTTINAIILILGGVYGWVTEAMIQSILVSAGIGLAGVGLTTDWIFNGCVKAFEYQFKCEMEYGGRDVVMSVITGDLEYLIVYDEDGYVLDFFYDDFSYSSPTQSINSRCSEAVGYAAKAFSIKYITASDPTLPLPVNGPVF